MAEFIVELYISRGGTDAAKRSAQRARLAAEGLTRDGTPVHYLRSIFVPEDETCLVLYEAASADAVLEATQLAALRIERVAEAVVTSDETGST